MKLLMHRGPTLKIVSRSIVLVLCINFVDVSINGQLKQLRVIFLDSPYTNSKLGCEWIVAFNLLSVPRETQLDSRDRETSGPCSLILILHAILSQIL